MTRATSIRPAPLSHERKPASGEYPAITSSGVAGGEHGFRPAKCHAARLDPSVATSTLAPASSLSRALRSAIDRLGCSVADAASWCGVERRTVQRWLSGDAPVNVECVMRSRRLWPAFLDELTALTLGRTGT